MVVHADSWIEAIARRTAGSWRAVTENRAPARPVAAIGSGGNYALAAAKALADYEGDPEKLARRAMQIAAEVCVFTNDRLTVETV